MINSLLIEHRILTMQNFSFIPPEIPDNIPELRNEVRNFLDVELAGSSSIQLAQSWIAFDAGFSQKLGARGWIGMVWPRK